MDKKSITLVWAVLSVLVFAVGGCKSGTSQPTSEGETEMAIQIISSVFNEGETIPKKYTCDAENISPPLAWSGAPKETKSLVLIADDPDAPAGTWVHWVLYDIPASQASLSEGVQGVGTLGVNDFKKTSYGGPCPPKGKPHRYYFKLYALDATLGLKQGASKAEVEKAMKGYILSWGQLMGKYGR